MEGSAKYNLNERNGCQYILQPTLHAIYDKAYLSFEAMMAEDGTSIDEIAALYQLTMFLNQKCNYFDTVEGELALQQSINYFYQNSDYYSLSGQEAAVFAKSIQNFTIM